MTRKASDFHSGQRVTGQDHGTERTGVVVRIGTGLAFQPSTDDRDGPLDDREPWVWYAKRHKVVRYADQYVPEWKYLGSVYCAYFKPDGWVNFGMGVAREYRFRTFAEAVAACERHHARGNFHPEHGKMSA